MASQDSSKTEKPSSGKNYNIDEIIEILSKLHKLISDPDLPTHTEELKGTENSNGSNELNKKKSASCTPQQLTSALAESSKNVGLHRSKSVPVPQSSHDSYSYSIHKLRSSLRNMRLAFGKLKDFQNGIGKELKRLDRLENIINEVKTKRDSGVPDWIKNEFSDMSKNIFNLMCQVPLLSHKPLSTKPDGSDSQNGDSVNEGGAKEYLPGIHTDEKEFIKTSSFEEIKKKFDKFKIDRKLCLLCFAVFPESSVVKKRMLMYWWIGEGYVPIADAEKAVDEILKEFAEKGLIEPVKECRRPEPSSYKMPPLVHSVIVVLAQKVGFFNIYDEKGKAAMNKSKKKNVCLVEGSSRQKEAKVLNMKPEDIETVFNISERFPDFTFKWFSTMKTLRVLYLGKWERTVQRHIEVESAELMKDLSYMKELRFLSFQGISRIEKISGSICKLSKLTILDLRACHNLEMLPEHIDSLQNLIYLDISECYMLDRMPKKMSLLSKLEVLKGFVVSDADEESTCTLAELKHLPKLKKLSININRTNFTLDNLINALIAFKGIQSLKVSWGCISDQKKKGSGEVNDTGAAVTNTNQITEEKTQASNLAESKHKTQEKKDENKEKNIVSVAKSNETTRKKKDEKEEKLNASDPLETSKEEKLGEEGDNAPGKRSVSEGGETSDTLASGENKGSQADAVDNAEPEKKSASEIVEETSATPKSSKRAVTFAKKPKMEATMSSNLIQKCGLGPQELGKKLTRMVSGRKHVSNKIGLPPTLEKLDLQCFPETELPKWLLPGELGHLHKLYIKGGAKLTGFGEIPDGKTECTVEVLRLKFLPDLAVEWRDLREKLFPNLMFLEKYQCPKVTFCPCDGLGVWSSEPKQA